MCDSSVCDQIIAAVSAVRDDLDALTALPTWEHLSASAQRIRDAADHLVAVVAETRRSLRLAASSDECPHYDGTAKTDCSLCAGIDG